jgi:hypothetical protein
MMDARDKAEEKLRRSEAEHRKMAKQMEDHHRIITDRMILETSVSDKVTEMRTVRVIFPLNHPEEIKRVLPFRKRPRSE